jgi:hypothetical protein
LIARETRERARKIFRFHLRVFSRVLRAKTFYQLKSENC